MAKPRYKLVLPPKQELAGQDRNRDITKPYIDRIAQPEDTIVTQRGGGQLTIYEELLRDDQIASTFQQRRTAVQHAEWDVTPASESPEDVKIAEFVKDNLKRIKLDNLTDKMHYAVYYGYAVGEIMWGQRDSQVVIDRIKVRRQRRFRFGVNQELYLLTLNQPMGELMPADKFWIVSTGASHDDDPYGLGLAHYVYWPIYFKRNGYKFWLKFLERFGSPVTVAKAPGVAATDSVTQTAILEALRSVREDSAVVIPQGIEIELLTATQSGAASHKEFKEAMDASIAKIVLSQTMTSEAVGGQYKAEIHKDVRDEVIKSDADLLCESFNDQVIPRLVNYNFPNVTEYPKLWRDTDPPEDMNTRAERDTKIHAMGFDPTEEYVEETYGEGWVKRETPAPVPGQNPLDPGGQFAEASRIAHAMMANRGDQAQLVHEARRFAGQYEELLGERIDDLLAAAKETGDFTEFGERLAEMLEQGPPPAVTEKLTRGGFFARLMGMFREQSNAGQ